MRELIGLCEGLVEREAELLAVPYFHIVFSLPAQIADIAYQNKAAVYDILVQGFRRDPDHHGDRSKKKLGARGQRPLRSPPWGSALT